MMFLSSGGSSSSAQRVVLIPAEVVVRLLSFSVTRVKITEGAIPCKRGREDAREIRFAKSGPN